MPEVNIAQLSPEWFKLRREIPLTASQFADAVGLGKGKAYDFLRHLLEDDCASSPNSNSFTEHGISQEPLIDEAYQLLTGNITVQSGLWTPSSDNPLHNLVAASPDRKVVGNLSTSGVNNHSVSATSNISPKINDSIVPRKNINNTLHALSEVSTHKSNTPVFKSDLSISNNSKTEVLFRQGDLSINNDCVEGLCEYKAPVFCLYDEDRNKPHGIPRKYMVQIQGQLAVCGLKWCDFMAVCTKTKQICLKRVHFSPAYWNAVAGKLKIFIMVLHEAQARKKNGNPSFLDFFAAQQLCNERPPTIFLPGEASIVVENSLQRDEQNRYSYKNGQWVHYDVLMGDIMLSESKLCTEEMMDKIDRAIKMKTEYNK